MNAPYQFNDDQERWLHDLETTTEPQTEGRLHRLIASEGSQAGYCCLGRGCVVLAVPEVHHDVYGAFESEYIGAPASVVKALRLRGKLGSATDGRQQSLAELNDDGLTFKEIAEEIRA